MTGQATKKLRLNLVINNQTRAAINRLKVHRLLFNHLLHRCEWGNVEIGLNVVSRSTIRLLNRRYRKIDRPTTVLAFPQISAKSNRSVKLLGDIVICPSFVKTHFGRHFPTEFDRLLLHSLDHLIGHHH